MIKSFDELRFFVRADFQSREVIHLWRSLIFDPVIRFTVLMRWNEYLLNTGWPLLLRAPFLLWFRRLSVRLGFSIPLNVFDAGVALVHYGLIVITPDARIGRNCRMHVGVNIGGAAVFTDPETALGLAPRIGHNVYVGPGAKLFGRVEIADECVIGANAVITKSFLEPKSVLAGVPAKVISMEGSQGRVIRGAPTP